MSDWRALAKGDPLPPRFILAAARADLAARAHNQNAGVSPPYKQYAFCRHHVRKAASASDIIRAAIAEPGAALATNKRVTHRLYERPEALALALALALEAA